MQLSTKLKLFFKDHFHLVFKGSANNYQRLQQCLPDENGDVTCSVSFSSYTELKKYQKKLRTATVSLASAIAMVMVALIVSPYIFNPSGSQASSFQWVQNSWGGTAKTDPATKTGETDYSSKDTNVVAATGGVSLGLPASATTGDANFTSATVPSGMYRSNSSGNYSVSGTALALKKVNTVICGNLNECVSNYCSTTCQTPPCDASTASGTSCSFGGLTYGTVTAGGRIWMDRNLGATAVATAYNTQAAYGWLFQWGRSADGHQYTAWGGQSSPVLSGTTTSNSSGNTPGHANFIIETVNPGDWRVPQYNTLWETASGSINNPCPTGWHVPLQTEWASVVTALNITEYNSAASSALHLPAAGNRASYDAALRYQASYGLYWSSSPYSTSAYGLLLNSSSVNPTYNDKRAAGMSVRCLKN